MATPVVLITGALTGIGRATALAFASAHRLGPGLAITHYGNARRDPNYLKFLLFQIVAAQIHCP